jgi:hypothetical protein
MVYQIICRFSIHLLSMLMLVDYQHIFANISANSQTFPDIQFRYVAMLPNITKLSQRYRGIFDTVYAGIVHEIFDPPFFYQSIPRSIPLRSPINRINNFCIWLRTCREISKYKWLRAVMHSVEPRLCAVMHSTEFFGTARSWNTNVSAFVTAVKATV